MSMSLKHSKVKKTQSTRRHAFASFRERVDSMKIEPSLNLTKRVHDFVEVSHFLTTLNHWKEVNVSGDFTDFLDEIESLVQTLPQLLYYQNKVFQSLVKHIKINDANSIQPLLELLSQFIHDLGPDFLPHYEEYLKLITDLACSVNPNDLQNNKNSSNILEWCFNCLAFSFKYLSRSLVNDLIPTFENLLPTLSLTKKTYISRFSAEALSFLIRKSKSDSLDSIITYSFNNQTDLIINNQSYRESLVTLYAESMMSTSGNFHSKSSLILSKLVDHSLLLNDSKDSLSKGSIISIICDIILNLFNHGNPDACDKFYNLIINYLNELLDKDLNLQLLLSVSQILSTLSFAESGKKIKSWNPIISLLIKLINKIQNSSHESNSSLLNSLVYNFIILFRNGNNQEITRFHKTLFDSIISLNNASHFLVFADSNLSISESKLLSFGIANHIQNFINKLSSKNFQSFDNLKKLAFFLNRLSAKESTLLNSIIIPHEVQDVIISELESFSKIASHDDLLEIYWRILVLKYNTKFFNLPTQYFIKLIKQLFNESFKLDSKLSHDLIGIIIDLLTMSLSINPNPKLSNEIFDIVLLSNNFSRFKESSILMNSLKNFISTSHASLGDKLSLIANATIISVSDNLSSPNPKARLNSIELMIKLTSTVHSSDEISPILQQIQIIEQIPLTISNSRDLELRIRNLANTFKSLESPLEIEKKSISNYMIGLLTNKFKPCWDGVYKSLPFISESCSHYLWSLFSYLLKFDFNSQDSSYCDLTSVFDDNDEGSLADWQPNNYRIHDNFKHINEEFLSKYQNATVSIMDFAHELRGNSLYEYMLRSRVIQSLSVVPSVAESRSDELVPLVLKNNDENDNDENSNSPHWSVKDRTSLISVFSKFKNLNKIHDKDAFKAHIMDMLSHRQSQMQEVALDVLMNWKIPGVNKYKDNLKNLLDDTIFRDEVTKLVVKGSDSTIEDQDYPTVVPVILRLLFGRAQGASKTTSKIGKKFAVFSVLPNFPDQYIKEFLEIGSSRTSYEAYFSGDLDLDSVDSFEIRRILGYVHLLEEAYGSLGYKYKEVLEATIQPLLFSLIVAQDKIDKLKGEEDIIFVKSIRSIRQNGLKCFETLFKLLGPKFEWDQYVGLIYNSIIKARLEKFSDENIQQPSSVLKIILGWIESDNVNEFLYIDDFAPVKAVVSLLFNQHLKESVLSVVLEFCIKALTRNKIDDDRYFTLAAILVDSLLQNLPSVIEKTTDRDTNSKAIHILLLIIEGNYIDEDSTRSSLLRSLTSALDKPQSQVISKDKTNILLSLSALINEFDCSFDELSGLYKSVSKAFRVYSDRSIRQTLVTVVQSIGNKFVDYQVVGELLDDLNANSPKRIEEPDFERRLSAFKTINEDLYKTFSTDQWFPIINCALFFINDELELAIRTNAAFTLKRFVDCFSEKESIEAASKFIHSFKDTVLPHLRIGIRHHNQDVQSEYIGLLSHIVEHNKYLPEFENMKVLFGEDDESNFFENITHIQLFSRQKAIRDLAGLRNELSGSNISHYLLPIVESYAVAKEEKFRNISNEAVVTIGLLCTCVTWTQYKALYRRYLAALKSSKPEELKVRVNIIVSVSKSLLDSTNSRKEGKNDDILKDFPTNQLEVDTYITKELFPSILKVLNVRDDQTIVARAPLAEALTCLIMCITEDLIETELPGTLTSTCQVMRSRSEELRDAVRKSLSKIVTILGAKYFKFILQELKTALSRGSQIHVLSFTVHHILVLISPILEHGDLNDSTGLLVDIIMEDTFGAAGQEKDAEGYTSKMKEVKHKKSFDSAEILASNISLENFSFLVHPLKLLLSENVSYKTENKLDELLKRYALGLNHNSSSSTKEILVVCFELYKQSAKESEDRPFKGKKISESEEHFLVQLNARPLKMQTKNNQYISTLQKFSLELLRVSITRNDALLTVSNLEGFIPILQESLNSDNEGVCISSLKVLNIIVRLSFSEDIDEIFKSCAAKSLDIVKDSPSTNSEICQSSLKFLATIIRHKPNVELSDAAISYVLERVLPDLEEPNKQGLAFNFLKAVVSQHIMIPEVYDVMDKVAKIMVVNHSKEIRDMSRSVYFQFLMEYDQGRGRLEKQFKFLVNNLGYVTQAGRQSVMELIHSVVLKSGTEFLKKLASSFFVALANIVVSDDVAKCRELASTLISNIFKKLGTSNSSNIEAYVNAWLTQSSNDLLKRCGLNIYKIYIGEFGVGSNKRLDDVAKETIEITLKKSRNANEDSSDTLWEDVYINLSAFNSICSKLREEVFKEKYGDIWVSVIEVLLYPHSWVRLISCRLVGLLLSNLDNLEFEISDYQIQTIAYRLLHQLGAPSVSKELGTQIVKNLVLIVMRWESNKTLFIHNQDKVADTDEEQTRYKYASEYMVSRVCAIMRQERNFKDAYISKVSAIQFSAMLVQIMDENKIAEAAEKILLGLYNFTELDPSRSDEDAKLVELTTECMQIIENKMGVSDYTAIYSKVKLLVNSRRQERKTKRAQMALNAPGVAAKKKMKKHERFREKRKHVKDENGYYRAKKKRTI